MKLEDKIEELLSKSEFMADDRAVFEQFKSALRRGEIRSAERDADGILRTTAVCRAKEGVSSAFAGSTAGKRGSSCAVTSGGVPILVAAGAEPPAPIRIAGRSK